MGDASSEPDILIQDSPVDSAKPATRSHVKSNIFFPPKGQDTSSRARGYEDTDTSAEERRYLPPGSHDYEKMDPNVTAIEIPGSKSDAKPEYVSQQHVNGVLLGKSKNKNFGNPFRPRNTLDQPSRAASNKLLSTSHDSKKVALKGGQSSTGPDRSYKRQKLGNEPETVSDSEGEDPLSTFQRGRLRRPQHGWNPFNFDNDTAKPKKRSRMLTGETSTREYQTVEQTMSSAKYASNRRKQTTLHSLRSASDRSVTQRSTKSSPSEIVQVGTSSEISKPKTNGSATETRSRFFGDQISPVSIATSGISIDIEEPDHTATYQATKRGRKATKRSLVDAGISSEEEKELLMVQPSALSSPATSRHKHTASVEQAEQSSQQVAQPVQNSDRRSQVSSTAKPTNSETQTEQFPIKWLATDQRPWGTEADFSLVFNRTRNCLDLYCDGTSFDEDLVPISLVRKIWTSKSNTETKLRLDMSKRDKRPTNILIDCCGDRASTQLELLLSRKTSNELTMLPKDKFEKMFENFQRERLKAFSRGNEAADIQLIQAKKRLREMETASKREEEPENKRVKVKPKMRDSLRGNAETEVQSLDKDTGATPALAPSENEGRALTMREKDIEEPARRHTEIDDILANVQAGASGLQRAGLRPRRTRQSATSVDEHLLDIKEAPSYPRYSEIYGLGRQWKRPLTYPKEGKKRATVEFSDLPKLDEGECLNDSLIEFYLRFLTKTLEEQFPDTAQNVYLFNTYFFTSLKGNSRDINYAAVKKWTRNVDLFTYDYIVVPINENAHWYLAIICNLPSLERKVPAVDGDSDAEELENRSHENNTAPDTLKKQQEGKKAEETKMDDNIVLDSGSEQSKAEPSTPLRCDEEGARASLSEMRLDDLAQQQSDELRKNELPENKCKDLAGIVESLPTDLPASHIEVRIPRRTSEERKLETMASETRCNEAAKRVSNSRKGKRKSGGLVIRNPELPTIVTLDSLGLAHPPAIRALKDYLHEEAKEKRGGMTWDDTHIKGMTAKGIPQQSNFSDCGLYLLGYMDKFMESPKDFVTKMLLKQFDEAKDWPKLRPNDMRTTLRDLIQDLHKEQENERVEKSKILHRISDARPLPESEAQPQPKTAKNSPKTVPKEDVQNQNPIPEVPREEQQVPLDPQKRILKRRDIPALTYKSALAAALPLDASSWDDEPDATKLRSPTTTDLGDNLGSPSANREIGSVVPDSQGEDTVEGEGNPNDKRSPNPKSGQRGLQENVSREHGRDSEPKRSLPTAAGGPEDPEQHLSLLEYGHKPDANRDSPMPQGPQRHLGKSEHDADGSITKEQKLLSKSVLEKSTVAIAPSATERHKDESVTPEKVTGDNEEHAQARDKKERRKKRPRPVEIINLDA